MNFGGGTNRKRSWGAEKAVGKKREVKKKKVKNKPAQSKPPKRARVVKEEELLKPSQGQVLLPNFHVHVLHRMVTH